MAGAGYDIGASLADSSTATSGLNDTLNISGDVYHGPSTTQLLIVAGAVVGALVLAWLLFRR